MDKKMTEAKKILELIENVKPDDTEILDEIDARVWCWLKNCPYKKLDDFVYGPEKTFVQLHEIRYTRSLDAQEALGPDGWSISYHAGPDGKPCLCMFYKGHLKTKVVGDTESGAIATEALARLHAIIQALEFERGK